jgi:hypothetical protein
MGVAGVLLTLVSSTATILLAALSAACLFLGTRALFSNRRPLFVFYAGVLMMADTMATALVALPIIVPYLSFGTGLAAIVAGSSMIRLASIIGPNVSRDREGDALFRHSAVSSLIKGLGYIGAVMMASFLFLLVSFNAILGTFPLTFLAVCVLVIVVCLTILAALRPSAQ